MTVAKGPAPRIPGSQRVPKYEGSEPASHGMRCIRLSLKCLRFLEEITQKAARPPSESVNLREARDMHIYASVYISVYMHLFT